METLKIYQERDIVTQVQQRSTQFLERIHALGDHALVGQTRDIGFIGALELVKDKASKQQSPHIT